MTAAQTAQASTAEPVSWETKPAATYYQPPGPAAPVPPVIPKTVDYGHGHGMLFINFTDFTVCFACRSGGCF